MASKAFRGSTVGCVVGFALIAPETPAEACRLLAEGAPGSTIAVAGGTDLLLDLDSGRFAPRRVVSLRRLPWRSVRWEGERFVIGSTAPLSEIEADPKVRTQLPGFLVAVRAVGSRALRHRATLGGNLGRASPASDLIPILLALDASASIVGPHGRRQTTVDSLIEAPRTLALAPGELVESITIPRPTPCAYVWQRVRPSNDISQVGAAVAAPTAQTGWTLALGGVWPRPRRVLDAERCLVSARPTETEVELAGQEASAHAPFVTDKRATEAYRRRLVRSLVRQAVRMALASKKAPPVRPAARPPKRKRR
jgi:carbon-monoxide dehydrogenase medium subunit